MKTTQKIKSRKQAEEVLIQQASQDEGFRGELKSDPRAAITKALNIQVPSNIEITVLEETNRHLYLVLPPASARGELTEQELTMVAGGLREEAEEIDEESDFLAKIRW